MTKEQLETRNAFAIAVNISVFLFLAWRITGLELFMYPLGVPLLFLILLPFIVLWSVVIGLWAIVVAGLRWLSDWTLFRRSRLDTLRTALAFYANHRSYESEGEQEFTFPSPYPAASKMKIPAHGPMVLDDKGQKAREALEASKPSVRR